MTAKTFIMLQRCLFQINAVQSTSNSS